MNFTKEIINLSGLDDNQIKNKLSELNIALTPEEGKKIQNEMQNKPLIFDSRNIINSSTGSASCILGFKKRNFIFFIN